jgi:hypothetical protein
MTDINAARWKCAARRSDLFFHVSRLQVNTDTSYFGGEAAFQAEREKRLSATIQPVAKSSCRSIVAAPRRRSPSGDSLPNRTRCQIKPSLSRKSFATASTVFLSTSTRSFSLCMVRSSNFADSLSRSSRSSGFASRASERMMGVRAQLGNNSCYPLQDIKIEGGDPAWPLLALDSLLQNRFLAIFVA